MGNPRGRPKKPADELLAERCELRLTSAELRLFEQAAQKADLSLSAWLRDRAAKAAKRESKRD
jgi:hypothetical protein